jgi:hypothetical protein
MVVLEVEAPASLGTAAAIALEYGAAQLSWDADTLRSTVLPCPHQTAR